MGTIEDKLNKLLDTKEAIKNSIVAKGQTISDTDTFASYASKISAIETGVDTTDATAAADDILYPEIAYVNGKKVTGSIRTKAASDITTDGPTVTAPAGYYKTDVSASVQSAEQATPSISVSDTGLITASSTQTSGYVTADTKSATKQLTTQAAKTITPGTNSQTAVASGVYTTGVITVEGDTNLVAANIKSGETIFGVTGTYVPVFA